MTSLLSLIELLVWIKNYIKVDAFEEAQNNYVVMRDKLLSISRVYIFRYITLFSLFYPRVVKRYPDTVRISIYIYTFIGYASNFIIILFITKYDTRSLAY